MKIGFYVVNLDDSTHTGTHWTSFYYNPVYSIYIDAFGFIALEQVQNKIRPYMYSDIDIQDMDSSACGYYCIAFIKFLYGKHDKYKYFEAFLNGTLPIFSEKHTICVQIFGNFPNVFASE